MSNFNYIKSGFRAVNQIAAYPYSRYFKSNQKKNQNSRSKIKIDNLSKLAKPYFDKDFYLGQNPDVADEGIDPLIHFLIHGHFEGRDPSSTFSLHWYRQNHMLDEPFSENPLIHFLNRIKLPNIMKNPPMSPELLDKISRAFDKDYYMSMYSSQIPLNVDPLNYFLRVGWLLGHNPNKSFSSIYYSKINRNILPMGMNPFVHYWSVGKKMGLSADHTLSKHPDIKEAEKLFDREFYISANNEITKLGIDPFEHYMITGWKEGKDPSKNFSTVLYIRSYPDVLESGIHPLLHYALEGDGRRAKWDRPHLAISPGIEHYSETHIAARQQDMCFPLPLEAAKRIIVIVVPEHNEMSGGIFSMFSIANRLKKTKAHHGYDVILMTNPNDNNHTYCRQTNFRNQEDVFRFEQIIYCQGAEEIYLHIPEYATEGFLSRCSERVVRYLLSRKNLYVNILNQNIELMPEKNAYADLRRASNQLTQSVAHHAYFSQEHADRYQLPTLLLPAYTDIREYIPSKSSAKDDIIIYSIDDIWYKAEVIEKVRAAFPSYKLIEIRGITFDHYMDLATRCRFSISFGEGFDGYVAQPIYQGGIGFTVYREDFFPSKDFLQYENFFSDAQSFIDGLVSVMVKLSRDHTRHDALNKDLVDEWNKLYSLEDYFSKIDKLAMREFEILPSMEAE